jgi:hypothetical protein
MLEEDIKHYLNKHPHLYEPELQKKIRQLLQWMDFDQDRKFLITPENAVKLAKTITLPPARPRFRNIIPNWKIRLSRFLVGYKKIQPPQSWKSF